MKVTDTIRTKETGPVQAVESALEKFEGNLQGYTLADITYQEINLEWQSSRGSYNVEIEAVI